MEHKPFRDLSHVADLVPETPKVSLTRRERLERWIEVLGHEPGRALNTLREIEHKPRDARRASRVDNSPLTVAYNDPVLRADGLASDSGMQSTISSSRTRRLIGSSARASTGRA